MGGVAEFRTQAHSFSNVREFGEFRGSSPEGLRKEEAESPPTLGQRVGWFWGEALHLLKGVSKKGETRRAS